MPRRADYVVVGSGLTGATIARSLADAVPGLLVCGRLGEYRYYDMDQAIARAMVHARRLLARLAAL